MYAADERSFSEIGQEVPASKLLSKVNPDARRDCRRARSLITVLAMSSAPFLNVTTVGDTLEIRPTGSWTVVNANLLERLFSAVVPQLDSAKRLSVNLAD